MKNATLFAFTLLILAPALPGQESRSVGNEVFPGPGFWELEFKRHDVSLPLLEFATRTRELPIALQLVGGEDRVWLDLDDGPHDTTGAAEKGELPPASSRELGARERWLISTVKERFKGVSAIESVERATIRHDGVHRSATSERGIEVRGPRGALGPVREFFDRFTAGSRKTVTISLRVIEVEGGSDRSEASAVADVADVKELDRRIQEIDRLVKRGAAPSFIMSPTIRVFANQNAKASGTEQTSYIKDYNVEVVGNQKIADPVVGVIDEGIEIDLTPIYDPDQNAMIVSGSVGFSHLVRPIPEHRLKLADTEVTVQLPSVRSSRWKGDVRLEAGENAFRITGLKHYPPKSEKIMNVEVWCLITLDGGEPALQKGEIVERDDKNGNVFVRFPHDYVPDDPWNKAPKEVAVYRKNEKIGTARLAGGWVLPDSKHPVIAVYQLVEGTPKDGDSVR